jgi:hypothetical protein
MAFQSGAGSSLGDHPRADIVEVSLPQHGSHQSVFQAGVLYRAYPNLQLRAGTTLATDSRNMGNRSKSWDR